MLEVEIMLSTVTTKGQVTIPKSIREALQIKSNDKIDFIRQGEKLYLVPIKTLKDFRGAVRSKTAIPFNSARNQAKAAVAKRVIKEMG
jgi:AbrB family looped-hinge helix DNA binding protein